MREISVPWGYAHIAPSLIELDSRLAADSQSVSVTKTSYIANAQGKECAFAVTRKCQTASGGSFYTKIVGQFVPEQGSSRFVVHIPRLTADSSQPLSTTVDIQSMQLVHESIDRGFCASPLRPAGLMQIVELKLHVIDLKQLEWSKTALIACYLLTQIQNTSDEDLSKILYNSFSDIRFENT